MTAMSKLLLLVIVGSASVSVAAPIRQPASKPTASPAAKRVDPFASLKVVTPRDRLPPLFSVRPRHSPGQSTKRARRIVVKVASNPRGAVVSWGGKVLGTTPLMISGSPRATPMDLTLRRKGYMVLRTRIMRRARRGYYFKLVPAKFH